MVNILGWRNIITCSILGTVRLVFLSPKWIPFLPRHLKLSILKIHVIRNVGQFFLILKSMSIIYKYTKTLFLLDKSSFLYFFMLWSHLALLIHWGLRNYSEIDIKEERRNNKKLSKKSLGNYFFGDRNLYKNIMFGWKRS